MTKHQHCYQSKIFAQKKKSIRLKRKKLKLKKKRKRNRKHADDTQYLRCRHCVYAKNSRTKRSREKHAPEVSTRHRKLNSIREIRCFKNKRNDIQKTQAQSKCRNELTKTSSIFESESVIAKNNTQRTNHLSKTSTSCVRRYYNSTTVYTDRYIDRCRQKPVVYTVDVLQLERNHNDKTFFFFSLSLIDSKINGVADVCFSYCVAARFSTAMLTREHSLSKVKFSQLVERCAFNADYV